MAWVGEAKGLLCESVDAIVEAVEAEIAALRPRGPPLVILYDRSNEPAYEWRLGTGLVGGHAYNSSSWSLADLSRVDVAEPLRDRLGSTAIGARALEPFAVLCFQKEAILEVARTGADRCLIVFSRWLLDEFRRRPPEAFRHLWEFRPRPGFEVMKRYRRTTVVLLGENVSWQDALAFPDMRTLPDGASAKGC
jgi:hypothetical protein